VISGARPGDPGFGETPEAAWGTLDAGEHSERIPTARGDYGAFYAGVASAISHGAAVPVDPTDAVAGLRVIAAAHAAVKTSAQQK
jgi:predicted dehydrogenase